MLRYRYGGMRGRAHALISSERAITGQAMREYFSDAVLLCWLDGKTNVTAPGGVVSSWKDAREGFPYAVTAAGSAQPAFNSEIGEIDFDGSDDALDGALDAMFDIGNKALSIYTVWTPTIQGVGNYGLAYIANLLASATRYMGTYTWNNGGSPSIEVNMGPRGGGESTWGLGIPPSGRVVTRVSRDAAGNNTARLMNKAQTAGNGMDANPAGTNLLTIGRQPAGSGWYGGHLVNAVIVINRVGTADDDDIVRRYARNWSPLGIAS